MTMFPASLAHTLNGNTFGDIQGDLLSNNKTRISIRVGCGRKRTLKARSKPSAALEGESPRIRIADMMDLSFVRSPGYGSDLVACNGYRIHVAKYQGKVVAVKIYRGLNSAQRLEADLKINRSLLHPTVLQAVAVCRASQTPFLVFSMESDIPISLGSFKTLVCYLADALSHSEKESVIVGAQLIRDVSAGLDYLGGIEQSFSVSRLTFDLLVDESNNICITVGVGENETGIQEDGYLDVFHKLCLKTFLEANNECHIDKSQAPTVAAPESRYEPDLLFSEPQGDPAMEPSFESDCLPIEPRREYAFIPGRTLGSLSLRRIYTDYARFMRNITKNIRHLRRKRHSNSTAVAHRCPGYRRDEVTSSPSVLRTAIIQHLTPSPREICQVCQQLVENGIFNCYCGQGDNGMSPTIQCYRCSVWSHLACQVNSDVDRPLCPSCLVSENQSHVDEVNSPSVQSYPAELEEVNITSSEADQVHSPKKYRSRLAGYAQNHALKIKYVNNTHRAYPPSWTSVVFVNGVERGRGKSRSHKAHARERAAAKAIGTLEGPWFY
ncbi:hypothetical protein C8J56DRAFT_261307 [Mycena floridula]|nr:hypothetical protein C8J56DRAFT_261307 [Mycena floridula]